MSSALSDLLDIVDAQPIPEKHASSHWVRYGTDTKIARQGKQLALEAAGFSAHTKPTLTWRLLQSLERLSYRGFTSSLESYLRVEEAGDRLSQDLARGIECVAPPKRMFWDARLSHERIFMTALSVLCDFFRSQQLSPRTFAVIGDGDGFFGALLRRCIPGIRLYCIDLPKTMVFQARTHEKADPSVRMSLFGSGKADVANSDIILTLPMEVEQIEDTIDCAVNISSFQEMNNASIAGYFSFLRRRSAPSSIFYCINHLSKKLIGGEVANFLEYPWRPEDKIFIDGPCPYFTHYLAPFTLSYGPRTLGMRIPFINGFGGVIRHRLAHLAPNP